MSGWKVQDMMLAAGALMASLSAVPAQAADAPGVTATTIKVHSVSLEGNLEGNSPDRDVIVILPPGYEQNKAKRYPVIYFLHGYFAGAKAVNDLVKFGEAVAGEADKGHEFILVQPDSYTKFGGAMYADSMTTGNFEGFIAKELVAYVDKHYRTIARPSARGLAGHSMGGYGTLKIAMKYPGIFSSIYAMSACCLSARSITPEQGAKLEAMSMEDAVKAPFGDRASFAQFSAWSPNPNKPPFYMDFGVKDGQIQPEIVAQWATQAPNALLPQYANVLKRYTAIGLEVGDKDGLIKDDTTMHELMNKFGIAHDWAVFDGGHGDKLGQRVRDALLPFFAAHLATK